MSERDQQPYVIVERRGSGLVAFLWGSLVGASVALLFASKTGEETQKDLREGARRFRDDLGGKLGDLRGSFEEGIERVREETVEHVDAARERQQMAGEAIKAGKDAARRARSDLEQRVAESKAAYKAARNNQDGDGVEDGIEGETAR
jgi:gas vesicle protein